jgi:hypothetical protein
VAISEKVLQRFQDDWKDASPKYQRQAIDFLSSSLERFLREGLADRHFISRLEQGEEYEYQQRLAELLFAAYLWQHGFSLSSRNAGPDFRAEKNGKVIWFELTTPEPEGIPPYYLNTPKIGDPVLARSVPHEALTLRWTSAFIGKARKLLGDLAKETPGYIATGIVREHEPYVIVINSRLLSAWPFNLIGVSQFPYAVETCLGVGPLAASIDRTSGEVVWSGRQQRLEIKREGRASIPSDTFLDKRFAGISAVIGINLSANFICGDVPHSIAVHNPLASNPIPHELVPAQQTWICRINDDNYVVEPLT